MTTPTNPPAETFTRIEVVAPRTRLLVQMGGDPLVVLALARECIQASELLRETETEASVAIPPCTGEPHPHPGVCANNPPEVIP